MSVKAHIRDFQSLQKVDLVIDGFTVLLGESNIGKSAVVRALQACLRNQEGTGFVRRGAEYAAAQLEFPDNHTITWRKGEKIHEFVVDGIPYKKPGRSAPPAIEALGFDLIKSPQGDKIDITVQDQWEPLFKVLLDPALAASLMTKASRLDVIIRASKEARKDKSSAEKTLEVRESDIYNLDKDIDVTAELFRVFEPIVLRLSSERDALLKKQAILSRVRFLSDSFGQIEEELTFLQQEIPFCPYESLADQVNQLASLTSLESALSVLEQELQVVNQFTSFGVISFSQFEFQYKTFDQLTSLSLRFQSLTDEINTIISVDVPLPTLGFVEGVVSNFLELRKSYWLWVELSKELSTVSEVLVVKEADSAASEGALLALQKELGVCPMCDKPFVECSDV